MRQVNVPTLPRRATRGNALDAFMADVERLRTTFADDRALADAVAIRLKALLEDPEWLCEEHRQPAEDSYRQHVLRVSPDSGFSVVSLIWKPGQRTPIHDHVSWCVVGVYRGVEEEVRYSLYEDGTGPFLVERERRLTHPGETVALVPPDEDIHDVCNAGDTLAISIHVYGANIRERGTSILHRFDNLPIREQPGAAHRKRWRSPQAQPR